MPKTLRMPTVMAASQRFAQVPAVSIPRSVFDRSHGHKTTFDAGYLVPIFVDADVLPGDTFHMSMTALVRLTTPLKPIMDNMYLDTFFFFVPYRLVWSNFVRFMGEQDNPGASISYVIPVLGSGDWTFSPGAIYDYFGLIPGKTYGATSARPSALPLRAFNLIYNQWFRDENLINSLSVPLTDGPDGTSLYGMVKRGKRHDYFTSCLPFLQKGTAVSLPLGGSAPIIPVLAPLGSTPPYASATSDTPVWQTADGSPSNGQLQGVGGANPSNVQINASSNWDANSILKWADTKLKADLSAATAATINDIRQAFQIQKLLERDARGGTRYTEIIRAHFGVVSPDARLQRAEYLGGGSTPIMVTPIAQQTQTGITGGSTPLGNLAGVGVATAFGHGFHKSFTEHGVIIGIANVRADLTYQQGIERFWFKQTRYDIYWPEFAHIGEQAVLNREIWYTGGAGAGSATDTSVFGYQERYAEYRYKPSRISGLFRSDVAGTLDLWHLSEDFAAVPTLGQTFIEDQTSSILTRNVAVPTEPDFYADFYFKFRCARPMPVFGVPGFTDHF